MKKNKKNLTVLITGANGGMGELTVKHLMNQGYGHIIMAARTKAKADISAAELIRSTQYKGKVTTVGGFDMLDTSAIDTGIDALKGVKIDVLFLQAGGVFFTPNYQYLNNDHQKIEKTVYQNAYGGLYLFEVLHQQNKLNKGATILFAGGEGARGIRGMIDKPYIKTGNDYLQYISGKSGIPKYNAMNAIGISKMVSALLVQELAEKHKDEYKVFWFSPGLTAGTKGLRSLKGPKKFIMEKIGFNFMRWIGLAQSADDGAKKYVQAINGEYGHNGAVLGAPEKVALGKIQDQTPMNDAFSNPELRHTVYHHALQSLHLHKRQSVVA